VSIDDLKELKYKMAVHKTYLEDRLSYASILMESIDILITHQANDKMIEIWLSNVQKEVSEIKYLITMAEKV